ncbi:UvrB/UvrC motif-containing protein [Sulfuriroseicoccus oceanibius]|uniref:UvrB/UvrC motif-containing protein n=1 Tax=Sulfuriroseicoccus oceanibius TaxID=2707525 RepID=A0A6B3L5C2_9BACT|nr:UvrB/UvrC motif-containing protein [Sulfuriroseicoccus oceanibius]QQL44896.1 UvrB/UvrC motif-containing protein [Sulfuriroseicoccus oceanibius]
MKCDLCDEKATVFLTQIVDGKMQKVNLCETCAQDKGVTDPTGFALADLLFGFGNEEEVEIPGFEATECPSCGYPLEQLKKSGRLGCAKCYDAFAPSLQSLVKAMHKGVRHHGKVPSGAVMRRVLDERRQELEEELAKAIAEERYEDAARFRDQLTEVEATIAEGAADSDSSGKD